MNTQDKCPLCGEVSIILIESLPANNINILYRNTFKFKRAIKSDYIKYYQCRYCDIKFFDPMEPGDEGLYESLQNYSWYYMADKWEYHCAKKYLNSTDRVLEIGAGKAAFALIIGSQFYTGLEYNDKAIKQANKDGVRLVKQSIQAHAAEGNSYDVIVSFQVLEHVSDPAEFIRSSLKCLKKGGRLIISVPAHENYLGEAINNILDLPPHHLTHWTAKTLEKMESLFGLKLLAIEYEPVAFYHKKHMRKIIIESKIRKFFGMKHQLVDISFLAKLISKTASIVSLFLPLSTECVNGHTVVSVFKK